VGQASTWRLVNTLFLASLALGACSHAPEERVERHLRAAAAYRAQGDVARGAAELAAAVALAPSRPDLRVQLAEALVAQGRLRRAQREYRAALRSAPEMTAARVGLGDVLLARGRRAAAVRIWRQAVDRDPAEPDPLRRLAVELARAGRWRKALAMFRRLGRIDSSPPASVLAWWGTTLAHAGESDDARRTYDRALALDAREPTALRGLGALLAREPAERARGIALLEAAVRVDPGDAAALDAFGEALVEAGAAAKAQPLMRRALAATPPGTREHSRRSAAVTSITERMARVPAEPHAPNVVLFVIDTLRADHVGCYGYPRATTPRIDALAREGVVFLQAISQAPWTAASVGSLLTGLYPAVHGLDGGVEWDPGRPGRHLPFVAQRVLRDAEPTLATVLRAHGYRTAGFVSNVYLHAILGFAQGFDVYDDGHEDYSDDVMTQKRRGDETNRRASAWLDTRPPEPFLLFVHYNDPHWPYDPPTPVGREWVAGYRGALTPKDTGLVVETEGRRARDLDADDLAYLEGLYDGEIRAADAHLGALVDRLRQSGLERAVLTIITSDHGEEFLDHGSTSHGYTLFEEQIHVPLVVHWPGRLAPARIGTQVRLVDVVPTVLELTGLGAASVPTQGTSLLGLLHDGAAQPPGDAFSEAPLRGALRAIRTPAGRKLIEDMAQGHMQLYDLRGDPHERLDHARKQPRATEILRRRLLRWAATNEQRRNASGPEAAQGGAVTVDGVLQRRLEALGYVADPQPP
jgi:arylsulfatase A-like enzyme/Tfp pilus assembly protein PilF